MFANNKTMSWFKAKSDEENTIIKEASKDVKTVRKKFKSSQAEIMTNRMEAVRLEIEKKKHLGERGL